MPTFANVGLPTVNPEVFRCIAAPGGLPAAINKKLTTTLNTVIGVQEFRTRLAENGFDAEFQTDKEAREFVAREIRKWRQAVKDSGAKRN